MKSEKAMEDLRIIRDTLARTSAGRSWSRWGGGVTWGMVFFIGGMVTHFRCVVGEDSFRSPVIVFTWLGLVFLAVGGQVLSHVSACRKDGLPAFPPLVNRLLVAFAAMLMMGITFVYIFNHIEHYEYISGTTMLIFGVAMVLVGLFANPDSLVLGALYCICGLLAVGPLCAWSFLVTALLGGVGSVGWGLWVFMRQGE